MFEFDSGHAVDVMKRPLDTWLSETYVQSRLRINHYYTKSVEEWKWKAARGRGGKPESLGERKHWYPDFEVRDRNEDEEVDIVRRLPDLRDLIERTPVKVEVDLPPAEHPFAEVATTEHKQAS